MRWTERQRAMLAEMGLRPWFRIDGAATTMERPPVAATITPIAPPKRAPVVAATSPDAAAEAATEAAWLIVGSPSESADDASRAAVEAEQDVLLANMLRAIGVSSQAGTPASRSLHVRAGTPVMDDLDRLHAQLRPRCVLVLGRAAAMALLGIDEPLGRLRGRVHAWRGVPVVVSFPLAYLLRNPGEKAKAWIDLCLAATAIDAPPP